MLRYVIFKGHVDFTIRFFLITYDFDRLIIELLSRDLDGSLIISFLCFRKGWGWQNLCRNVVLVDCAVSIRWEHELVLVDYYGVRLIKTFLLINRPEIRNLETILGLSLGTHARCEIFLGSSWDRRKQMVSVVVFFMIAFYFLFQFFWAYVGSVRRINTFITTSKRISILLMWCWCLLFQDGHSLLMQSMIWVSTALTRSNLLEHGVSWFQVALLGLILLITNSWLLHLAYNWFH